MPDLISKQRKRNYINKLIKLTEEYKKIILVVSDNVNSNQMTAIRKAVLGRAIILMGKKTLMRKAVDEQKEKNPKLLELKKYLNHNIGLVFTNDDVGEIRRIVQENKNLTPARQGQISPCEVIIPKGNTGMEPTKTGFFQALDIPTKITKGTVEIVNDFTILRKGQKVGNSESVLLQMLDIKPFKYGLECTHIYDDGVVFDSSVLDMKDETYEKIFQEAISNITNVSLGTGYPIQASVPIVLSSALSDILSVFVSLKTYDTAFGKEIKEFLQDPSKFQVKEEKKVEKVEKVEVKKVVEEKKVEVVEKPAEDEDAGFGGLF